MACLAAAQAARSSVAMSLPEIESQQKRADEMQLKQKEDPLALLEEIYKAAALEISAFNKIYNQEAPKSIGSVKNNTRTITAKQLKLGYGLIKNYELLFSRIVHPLSYTYQKFGYIPFKKLSSIVKTYENSSHLQPHLAAFNQLSRLWELMETTHLLSKIAFYKVAKLGDFFQTHLGTKDDCETADSITLLTCIGNSKIALAFTGYKLTIPEGLFLSSMPESPITNISFTSISFPTSFLVKEYQQKVQSIQKAALLAQAEEMEAWLRSEDRAPIKTKGVYLRWFTPLSKLNKGYAPSSGLKIDF